MIFLFLCFFSSNQVGSEYLPWVQHSFLLFKDFKQLDEQTCCSSSFFFFRYQIRSLALLTMSEIDTVNEIKKKRVALIDELQKLVKTRELRHTYVTKDLNRRIHELESEIHRMTLLHREAIKKCYSSNKTSLSIWTFRDERLWCIRDFLLKNRLWTDSRDHACPQIKKIFL